MVFQQSYRCEFCLEEPLSLYHPSPSSSFRYSFQRIRKKYQRLDDTLVSQGESRTPAQHFQGSRWSLLEDGLIVLQNDLSLYLPCWIADVERRNTLIQTIKDRFSERLSGRSPSRPTPVVTIYVFLVEKELEGTGSVDRATREEHDSVGRVMRESRREYERRNSCSMVPTAKAAQVLKGVMVAGDSRQMCMVCLEDVVGLAGSLPCHYVFHGNCITKWLETSHYCPVCRYELTTDS
ncbi:hypothetical protein Tsubulata_018583 [Turnera subulata]|uniref:RING-type E3 ubiquitin transferase n=1 Tax=Turnera subulata TaxID=218843 RepID=A0A9Q0G794_9ROSI|nr:hypothetical protein Tsubulata_018583 [Turnera subulata]